MRLPENTRLRGFQPVKKGPFPAADFGASEMVQGMAKGASIIAEKAGEIYATEQKARKDDYVIKNREAESEWNKANASIEEYGINDIPDQVRENLNITDSRFPDGIVPAHLVQPDMKRLAMQTTAEEYKSMIDDPELQRSAFDQQRLYEISVHDQMVARSVVQGGKYYKKQAVNEYETLKNEGLYAEAISRMENSQVPDEIKIPLIQEATREWANTEINSVIMRGSEKSQLQAVADLADDSHQLYQSLSEGERRSAFNGLTRRLAKREAQRASQVKEDTIRLKEDSKRLGESLDKGYNVGATEIPDMITQLTNRGEGKAARDLALSYSSYNQSAGLMQVAPEQAEDYISNLMQKLPKLGPLESQMATRVIENYHKNDRERQKDPIGTGDRFGTINIQPMDYSDGQKMSQSLGSRIGPGQRMSQNYHTPLHILAEGAEVDEFVNAFQNVQSIGEQMRFIRSVDDGLGDYTYDLFNQIEDKGIPSILISAGDAMRHNRADQARVILGGYHLMNSVEGKPPAYRMPDQLKKDLDADLTQQDVGTVFQYNDAKAGIMREATRFAYAQLAAKEGDYSGEYDSNIAREAVRMATGGVIDVGGSMIESPDRQMSDVQMERWFMSRDDSFLKGRVNDMYLSSGLNDSLFDDVADGDVKLINKNRGTWLFVDPDRGLIYDKSTGRPLELNYYKDSIPSKTDVSALNKAEAVSKGESFNQDIVDLMNQTLEE